MRILKSISAQLTLIVLICYLVLYVLSSITDFGLFSLVGNVVVFFALFRVLSHNIPKRREENAKFMRKTQPMVRWLRLQQTMRKDKAHRYFKCPNCGQYLRVPRGKGKITVTCRSCGASFQEKS